MEIVTINLPLVKAISPANICAEFCALISSVTREDNHKPTHYHFTKLQYSNILVFTHQSKTL